ncbi:hypothetical protein J6590_061215 [Homalodisca vitripennis]|nr:hypothetical protein J6590_061215 [Homalodisca vitripennis]
MASDYECFNDILRFKTAWTRGEWTNLIEPHALCGIKRRRLSNHFTCGKVLGEKRQILPERVADKGHVCAGFATGSDGEDQDTWTTPDSISLPRTLQGVERGPVSLSG